MSARTHYPCPDCGASLEPDPSGTVDGMLTWRCTRAGCVTTEQTKIPDARCPTCRELLKLEMRQQGSWRGTLHWSCTSTSNCVYPGKDLPPRGRFVEYTADTRPRFPGAWREDARIDWPEHPAPPGWTIAHGEGGAQLRVWPQLIQHLSNDVPTRIGEGLLIARGPEAAAPSWTPSERRTLVALSGLLDRGALPAASPIVEDDILTQLDVHNVTGQISNAPDVEETERALWLDLPVGYGDAQPHAFRGAFDSHAEERFLNALIAEIDDIKFVRSLTLQVPFQALTRSPALGEYRRVDMLLRLPNSVFKVIELDGPHHDSSRHVDALRDRQLGDAGIEVMRVGVVAFDADPSAAIKPIVDLWRAACGETPLEEPDARTFALMWEPVVAQRVQDALLRALIRGWIQPGKTWRIYLDDPLGAGKLGIPILRDLIATYDALYGTALAPDRIEWCKTPSGADLALDLRAWKSSLEMVRDDAGILEARAVMLSRSMALPRRVRASGILRGTQRVSDVVYTDISQAELEKPLLHIFGKPDFREGQFRAICAALRGEDCVVLLPTGAGKSIVYQLSTLLLPGASVIVDPLISLIEDQVRGLHSHGIDRVVGMTHQTSAADGLAELETILDAGDCQFVLTSPERFQSDKFRKHVATLGEHTGVSIAVIDEAHCVSEWGHSFRPAYLSIGRALRSVCSTDRDDRLAVIALTGTASHAVLYDVMHSLDIDHLQPESVIVPRSFNRPELSYAIAHEKEPTDYARLVQLVREIPDRFSLSNWATLENEYEGRRHPCAGIVFCPHAGGRQGVYAIAELLSRELRTTVEGYASTPPKGWEGGRDRDAAWKQVLRDRANRFIDGELPILVATKSFGMGIDKPDVRFVVHYGTPASLESYYQEAGRAGRDRRASTCTLLRVEIDSALEDKVLTAEETVEDIREQVGKYHRSDVLNQMWFHEGSFPGEARETIALKGTLVAIKEYVGTAAQLQLPDGTVDGERERCLYRLVQLGVIADYTKQFGSKTFTLQLAAVSSGEIKHALTVFVGRMQPGRARLMEEQLRSVDGTPFEVAIDCARRIVDFSYDVIEGARRRALLELVELSRVAKTDDEIRTRINAYFEVGSGSNAIANCIESERGGAVKYESWIELLDEELTAATAREYAGASSRFLESNVDHPGLLAIRGASELLVLDGDWPAARREFSILCTTANAKFGASDADIVNLLAACAFAVTRAELPGVSLIVETCRTFEDGRLLEPLLDQIPTDNLVSDDSDTLAAMFARMAHEIVDHHIPTGR